MATRLTTGAVGGADGKPFPTLAAYASMDFASNMLEATTLMTTTQSTITAGATRRVKRQIVGQLPSRSEHIDFKTPCRKCGNAPTWLVKRGSVVIERTCHMCGDVEFFEDEAVAHHGGSWLGSADDPATTTATRHAANRLGRPAGGYTKAATSDCDAWARAA